MATAVLSNTNLDFKLDGGDTAAKLTASADTLTCVGNEAPITLAGVASLNVSSTLQIGGAAVATQSYADSVVSGYATQSYVQDQLDGRHWKQAVRAAYGSNIALSGLNANSTLQPDSIGTALLVGERVLLLNQTAPAENGIYTVAAASETAIRATDADTEAPL